MLSRGLLLRKASLISKSKFCCVSSSPIANKNVKQSSPGEYLEKRGLLYQSTSPKLFEPDVVSQVKNLDKCEKVCAYAGFDPTSNCLHLGNFLQILTLYRMNFFGFKPIYLIGGATGMIGKIIFIK